MPVTHKHILTKKETLESLISIGIGVSHASLALCPSICHTHWNSLVQCGLYTVLLYLGRSFEIEWIVGKTVLMYVLLNEGSPAGLSHNIVLWERVRKIADSHLRRLLLTSELHPGEYRFRREDGGRLTHLSVGLVFFVSAGANNLFRWRTHYLSLKTTIE